jgi:hypothetical protein
MITIIIIMITIVIITIITIIIIIITTIIIIIIIITIIIITIRVLGKDGAQGGKIYLYSSQSLNWKAQAMKEMRARLGQAKDTTYTFSKEFVSQSLSLVDQAADKMAQVKAEKSEWLTQKGIHLMR